MPDCIFCKIARKEIPSYTLFEDEFTIAFLDINPVRSGHSLVIPKNHTANIFEISSEDWSHVQETVRKTARALERALLADGINIMMNNREHAGQVVDHAHVHLIPRHQGDGLRPWPHGSYKEGEAKDIAQAIVAKF